MKSETCKRVDTEENDAQVLEGPGSEHDQSLITTTCEYS